MRILPPVVETVEDEGDYRDLWPVGDLHLGAVDCREDVLLRRLEAIEADPKARVGFMGDGLDLIGPDDVRRWSPGVLATRYALAVNNPHGGLVSEGRKHLVELFQTIAAQGKVWWWLIGNHESKIIKRHSRDLGWEVCEELGIEDRYAGFDAGALVQFRTKGRSIGTWRADINHGGSGGKGLNSLRLKLGASNADAVLRGHTHEKLVSVEHGEQMLDSGKLADWPRVIARTGCFKQGEHDEAVVYERERDYPRKAASLLGPPVIRIYPHTKRTAEHGWAAFTYEVRT